MSSEKFYIVFAQRACDDPYYPPYTDAIRYYKSKEKAIESARMSRIRTKKCSNPEDCYYVEEHTFDDDVQIKEYSSSEISDDENYANEHGIDIRKHKEEMKKYYYYGEDEETYFNENDKQYKQEKMVYVIARKSIKKNKDDKEDEN
jgi:hypothetical protein